MARPRNLRGGRPESLRLPPTPPIDDQPLSDRQAEAYEVFATILEGVGEQEGHIKINRRGKSGGMEFCEKVPATPDFDEEYVRRHWGGGVFSCQMFGPDPDKPGRTKYLTSVTFYITGAPREKKEEGEDTSARHDGLGDVALRLQLAALEGMVKGMQSGQGGGGGNPLDNLEKLTNIVKNLMPANPGGGAGPSEMMAFAREVVGFGKEMAPEPGGEGGTPWSLIIDKAIEPAIGLITQALAAQKPGASAPAELAPIPEPPAIAGGPMWQVEMGKIVPRLLKRARDGKDPGLAAALFLEEAPPGAVQQLDGLVDDPNFVTTVLGLAEQMFPDVAAVRPWVTEFLQAVKEELIDSRQVEPTAAVEAEPKLKLENGEDGDD